MLESVGIHSTWVLVDTRRGLIDPRIPSVGGNHAIAAIELPDGYTNPVLQSVVTAKSGKRYLIFDPTNQWIPIGQIPPYEQGGYGILSEGGQSQLIALPVMAPASDRVDHTIHAQLDADGSLSATVVEQRFGYSAERPRVTFTEGSQQQQRDYLENRLRRDLNGISLEKIAATHSTDLSSPLELDYTFHVANYARNAGDLLLVRPRILGSDAWSLPRETRVWPIDLSAVQSRSDHIDLALPPGRRRRTTRTRLARHRLRLLSQRRHRRRHGTPLHPRIHREATGARRLPLRRPPQIHRARRLRRSHQRRPQEKVTATLR